MHSNTRRQEVQCSGSIKGTGTDLGRGQGRGISRRIDQSPEDRRPLREKQFILVTCIAFYLAKYFQI